MPLLQTHQDLAKSADFKKYVHDLNEPYQKMLYAANFAPNATNEVIPLPALGQPDELLKAQHAQPKLVEKVEITPAQAVTKPGLGLFSKTANQKTEAPTPQEEEKNKNTPSNQ